MRSLDAQRKERRRKERGREGGGKRSRRTTVPSFLRLMEKGGRKKNPALLALPPLVLGLQLWQVKGEGRRRGKERETVAKWNWSAPSVIDSREKERFTKIDIGPSRDAYYAKVHQTEGFRETSMHLLVIFFAVRSKVTAAEGGRDGGRGRR